MSRRALLDVNVLVALFDPDHIHHEAAHDWFDDHRKPGWATCPLTENGFVRVAANPAYGTQARTAELVVRLRRFCASGHHERWSDDISLVDEGLFNVDLVGSHRQLTDIYLLGLAKKHGGYLVTFDRTIPVRAVKGFRAEMLAIIGPVES